MSTSVIVSCPKCHSKLKLKNQANVGKRGPCPRCGHSFAFHENEESLDSEDVANTAFRVKSSLSSFQKKLPSAMQNNIMPKIVIALAFAVVCLAFLLSSGDDSESVASKPGTESSGISEFKEGSESITGFEATVELDQSITKQPKSSAFDPFEVTKPEVKTPYKKNPTKKPVALAKANNAAPQKRATSGSSRSAGKRSGWYQWRGPNRDGVSTETGLLDRWPSDGPPLAWRVRGLGGGMSSVTISGERLYTMGHIRGQSNIICRNLSDGSEVWATPIGGGSPNCTPTVDPEAGLVFGLTHGGDLACVDARTGSEVWSKNYGRDFGGRMMSGWGYSESPLVDGERLLCTPGANDSIIAALDKKTGSIIWKSRQPANVGRRGGDGAGYSSIVISNGAGTKQYVQLTGRGLISVAAADGRTLWTYNRVANGTANVPTPIVKGDYIFCSSGYGTGAGLVKLTKQGRDISADEVYFLGGNTLQNHHGGMVMLGDHVYMGHGHNNGFPVCVEFATGDIVWGGRTRGAGSGSAAIVCADGNLYFRYEDAKMALIEATPTGYNLKGQFRIAAKNGKSWPHPVVYNGHLYLRDQDELLCYDIRG